MPDIERFMRDAHILSRLVEQILEQGYLRRASREEVTFDQLNILKFLARPPVKLIKHVAGFLSASYAAASKAVDRLEKKGLVHCTPFERDRRAERVEVTPKGQKLIRTYERYKRNRLRAVLRGENSDQLAEGLERVIVALMREREVTGNPCLGCGAYYATECVSRAHGQPCSAVSCE